MLLKDLIPGLAEGAKILASEISGLFGFQGNTYYVVPASEANYNVLKTLYDVTYNDGSKAFSATIQEALDKCVSGRNDVIALSANAAHAQTAMLTVDKNRVHFVGLDALRSYGQGSKITMGITTAITDIFLLKNIGIRNTFTNIKFDSGNTLSQATGTVGEGGEYTIYRNCEFYNSVKLDSDTHAELVLNGDSPQFFNCTFGSLATAVSGNKIRPAVILTSGAVSGALSGGVSRDVLFDGCKFWKLAGGTGTAMIKIGSSDDLERFMEIKDCTFVAAKLGSTPAVAIASATLSKAQVLLSGSTIAVNCTKVGTATGIISGQPAIVATATIGVQAT